MAKIKKIDKKSLRDFREGFEKAVESFAKKSGVAIKLGGIRYNESSFTGKLEVVLADTASGMSAQEAIGRKSLELEGVFFGDDRPFSLWEAPNDSVRKEGIFALLVWSLFSI